MIICVNVDVGKCEIRHGMCISIQRYYLLTVAAPKMFQNGPVLRECEAAQRIRFSSDKYEKKYEFILVEIYHFIFVKQ